MPPRTAVECAGSIDAPGPLYRPVRSRSRLAVTRSQRIAAWDERDGGRAAKAKP